MSELLAAVHQLTGYDNRRKKALAGLSIIDVEPSELGEEWDWLAAPLVKYINTPPYSYYYEPLFRKYYRLLRDRYGTNPGDIVADLSTLGMDVIEAIAITETDAVDTERTDWSECDAYESVTRELNPRYLRLVEQAWDALLALPAYRLQQDQGKGLTAKPVNIKEVLAKHGWHEAGTFYEPIVRRGIAHNVTFRQHSTLSPVEVCYTDDHGNEQILQAEEVEDLLLGLLDECLACCFALRLFLFEYRERTGLTPLLLALQERVDISRCHFLEYASTDTLRVQEVAKESVNQQVQLRLECLDSSRDFFERLAEMLALLVTARRWFPVGETYFIALRSSNIPINFARIGSDALDSWLSGGIEDRDLLGHFDPVLMWPNRYPFARLRAVVRRSIRAGRNSWDAARLARSQELGSAPPPSFGVLTLDDISSSEAKRYRSELIFHGTSPDEIRRDLPSVLNYLRKQRRFHSEPAKKRWGRTAPHYVTGFIYSRIKRSRDRFFLPTSDYCVGRFEWRDPSFEAVLPKPLHGPQVEQLPNGLLVELNDRWPPADRWIPRGQ